MTLKHFYSILFVFTLLPSLTGIYADDVNIPATASEISPLSQGDHLPDVQVKTVEGNVIAIREAIQQKNTLLIFYRGGWCPYCNVHLAKLATIQDALQKYDIQTIAVSPDRPERLQRTVEKQSLHYTLYSDSKMKLAQAFGLAFRVDDATFNRYKNQYDIDLEADSGESHHLLPVPAAYLIDTTGVIRFRYYHENYKKRVPLEALLDAAEQLHTTQP